MLKLMLMRMLALRLTLTKYCFFLRSSILDQ